MSEKNQHLSFFSLLCAAQDFINLYYISLKYLFPASTASFSSSLIFKGKNWARFKLWTRRLHGTISQFSLYSHHCNSSHWVGFITNTEHQGCVSHSYQPKLQNLIIEWHQPIGRSSWKTGKIFFYKQRSIPTRIFSRPFTTGQNNLFQHRFLWDTTNDPPPLC